MYKHNQFFYQFIFCKHRLIPKHFYGDLRWLVTYKSFHILLTCHAVWKTNGSSSSVEETPNQPAISVLDVVGRITNREFLHIREGYETFHISPLMSGGWFIYQTRLGDDSARRHLCTALAVKQKFKRRCPLSDMAKTPNSQTNKTLIVVWYMNYKLCCCHILALSNSPHSSSWHTWIVLIHGTIKTTKCPTTFRRSWKPGPMCSNSGQLG